MKTPFKCDLCEAATEHDAARGHVPPGWRMRRFQGTDVLLLCDSCDDGGHVGEEPAPHLRDLLQRRGLIKDE